jgi:hypothetical protein
LPCRKLTLEIVHGEMTDVMERIRHGALEHRLQGPAKKFPNRYDRIHMNNIPDYAGGLMAVCLYARPLLREDWPSSVHFKVGSLAFANHAQYQADCLLMPDPDRIADHFRLRRQPGGPVPTQANTPVQVNLTPFQKTQYVTRHSVPFNGLDADQENIIPRERMLSRSTIEAYIHAHFLKLALPFYRSWAGHDSVLFPLNLSTMIPLIIHLADRGYPAHWMSNAITDICSGWIDTSARAPRTLVTKPEDVPGERMFPRQKISVEPWKAEMTTLLAIWRRLLPFGVIIPPPSSGLFVQFNCFMGARHLLVL